MPNDKDVVQAHNAPSIAGKPLPPPTTTQGGSIVLFYQYKEPIWNDKKHGKVVQDVLRLAQQHNVQGRGRIAPEGLNCTLSCKDAHQLRAFCQGLRDYDALFEQTDFKFTDGVAAAHLFGALSIRKTQELVAYGLVGDKAPSLEKHAGTHVDALEYHELLQDPDAVVIDVRNQYETQLGHFQSPCPRLDPQLRHSKEWPAWLEQNKPKLEGKKVLMYCTGGIRCERATALLNELDESKSCRGIYELQGGIERYLQTFPKGGFWKGKNYLFDKRQEQVPALKDTAAVEAECNTRCSVCRTKWTVYRGKFGCAKCKVPVIVCNACCKTDVSRMICELCRVGHRAPQVVPTSTGQKRKAVATNNTNDDDKSKTPPSRTKQLFVRRLPLTIRKSLLQDYLPSDVHRLEWIVDQSSGAFYGSAKVELEDSVDVEAVSKDLRRLHKRIRLEAGEWTAWKGVDGKDEEFPPRGQ